MLFRSRLPIELLDELQPGTVALPHGWGHQHAKGLGVASRTRGVNVNLLAADGADRLERVSGMAHLTGLPVDVRRAAGPRDTTTWSGLSPAEEIASRAGSARAAVGKGAAPGAVSSPDVGRTSSSPDPAGGLSP